MVNENFKRRALQAFLDSTANITQGTPTLVYEKNGAIPTPGQVQAHNSATKSAVSPPMPVTIVKEIPPENDGYITVAIAESEIYGDPDPFTEDDPAITGTKKKASWLKRHTRPDKYDPRGHKNYGKFDEKTRPVRMLKSDFTRYFLKDRKTGKYREGVVEPPEGRKAFLQQCISDYRNGELDEQAYKKNRPNDYEDFEKPKGSLRKAMGDAADFMGQPYTPEALRPIR